MKYIALVLILLVGSLAATVPHKRLSNKPFSFREKRTTLKRLARIRAASKRPIAAKPNTFRTAQFPISYSSPHTHPAQARFPGESVNKPNLVQMPQHDAAQKIMNIKPVNPGFKQNVAKSPIQQENKHISDKKTENKAAPLPPKPEESNKSAAPPVHKPEEKSEIKPTPDNKAVPVFPKPEEKKTEQTQAKESTDPVPKKEEPSMTEKVAEAVKSVPAAPVLTAIQTVTGMNKKADKHIEKQKEEENKEKQKETESKSQENKVQIPIEHVKPSNSKTLSKTNTIEEVRQLRGLHPTKDFVPHLGKDDSKLKSKKTAVKTANKPESKESFTVFLQITLVLGLSLII